MASPRKSGARMCPITGASEEATQELGSWISSEIADQVCKEWRAEESVPEMRAAAAETSLLPWAEKFARARGGAPLWLRWVFLATT